MGGPAAFTLARLHDAAGTSTLVRAPDIPFAWRSLLARVTEPAPLAGLPPGPLVMGIVNVTPDSFSDAGRHLDPADAIGFARGMVADGAAILDIGGESTRPGAVPPDTEEERRRVLPVLAGLTATGATLSVDTRRAPIMQAALDAGARMINDVSGLTFDPDAPSLLAGSTCTVALMHSRGTPATMQSLVTYGDVALDVARELAARVDAAVAAGIDRSRIVIDPGIGFAKTAAQNLELLRRLPLLANLGCRIILGVSRKSFLGRLAGEPAPDRRLPGSLAALADALALPHVIVRVHDTRETIQFVTVAAAIRSVAPGS